MPTQRRAEKRREQSEAQSAGHSPARRSWKKKTPEEVFLAQEEKLREEVTVIEEDLARKRQQLKKFEQARKIFEAD